MRQFASHYAQGVNEREFVRVDVVLECGLVHESAYGKVCHHEPVELLLYELGGFAAQHDAGVSQVCFEFIERALYLPPFVVQRSQFLSRCLGRGQDGGDEAIELFRVGDVL